LFPPSGKFRRGGNLPSTHVNYATRGYPVRALSRHHTGDWGEVNPEEWLANQNALVDGLRLLSVYHDRDRVKFYIITEADRSITNIMLPEDY
jgi:hypothetical protein